MGILIFVGAQNGGNRPGPRSTSGEKKSKCAPEGWRDKSWRKWSCADYKEKKICTEDGQKGTGVNKSNLGTVAHIWDSAWDAKDGYDGLSCKECGCDENEVEEKK